MTAAVALFTSDLRLHDNPVLRAALREADEVVPLFVLDDGVRDAGFAVPNRAAFLADCLADLDAGLRSRGGRLVVRRGDVVAQTCRAAAEADARTVHVAAAVTGYADRREGALRAALAEDGRELRVHEASRTIVPPGALTPGGKDHFAVFTPYFRRWADAPRRTVMGAPRAVRVPDAVRSQDVPSARALIRALCRPGGAGPSPGLPRGGETEARRRLAAWERGPLADYEERHDDLAADATSRLSADLHFGTLSPTEVRERAARRGGPGAEAFVRQLAWRDFHHQVLAARPDAARQDYRTRNDRWRDDPEAAEAWRAGRTGYPLVDAAMRQLLHEGWMHNRARLVAGSFLTKYLYVDWRVGARHFLDLLVDGDVANNQMNWQWVAGTGNDSRFNRMLNPLTQARRFDPRGTYVRRWVPELAEAEGLGGAAVHRPWRLPEPERAALGYPAPIVDLDVATGRFLGHRKG
ncbi:cryptochrome/photolyase family protein [Streptomyces avicenniae]|uniref:cryptochrome/photolyase family protein n=1 Tax=Streptomyces avicenniae TaxID=500153 RepID=UPI0006996F4D|nr:deoxyribodipyrimidine photo-lyase [Streptomyces avicenniae]